MSQPIQPGDLCIVVRDCCGEWLGRLISVREIKLIPRLYCDVCYYSIVDSLGVFNAIDGDGKMRRVPLSWLKRIEPLAELEGADNDAAIKEAARYMKARLLNA